MDETSRDKMVRSAAALIASRGVTGTSFSEVLADSGAPRGSIYHHFPEGKRQMAQDAVSWTAARVLAYLGAIPPESGRQVLDAFVGLWRQVVQSSNGSSGCALAGVALDTFDDEGGLLAVVRVAFRSWVAALAERLTAAGVPPDSAEPVALTALAAMEGALILCRAEGSVGPLDAVAAQLKLLLPQP
jgi:TetR/AcrR family transcriptional repressor of lmrAB and yxaGH operons